MMQRFFYHSFPRQNLNDLSLGLQILESVLKSGLLLTPEVIKWSEPGDANRKHEVLQIRICLTELSPCELSDHSKTFGNFALEFGQQAARELGAIPVFYVPNTNEPINGFNGVGQHLVMRLAQVQQIIENLLAIKSADPAQLPNPAWKEAQTYALKDAWSTLEELRFTGIAFQNLLFPVENLNYTPELGYYRQREWRIIENFALNNVWPFRALTDEEKAFLLSINPFFHKTFSFHDLVNETIVNRCRFFTELQGRPVLSRVSRIIVPGAVIREAADLVKAAGFNLPVAALEGIC